MENQKIQCHFVPNTHWDREWRYSARRTQYNLGYLLDMLFEILDKNPDYKHFHLDSQTMPVQDYLEVYPEKKEKFQKYVREGRIAIGPWFCLPDEFSVSGESLIRNLLLGHKIGKEMGGVSKTGYSPFGWGQISQLPQIYSGFGINFASFYRGLNTYVAPRSEFFWEGADGTRIYASRLATRPRYNVWYCVHRPVYFNADCNNRVFKWDGSNGVFKFIDGARNGMDMQYTHPFYRYFTENVEKGGRQCVEEQDGEWTTAHRFWSESHDSSCPDAREVRLVKDLNDALPDCDVFFSTIKDFENSVIQNFDPKSTLLKGEMRAPSTAESVSPLLGWVTSARMYIKQANFNAEKELTLYAEPLAVFAAFCGANYPKNFIALSYNYLLQNHGHDSIGGCSRDVVADDVMSRFKQSREISNCVYERAYIDVAGDIKLEGFEEEDSAIVVYNPAPFKRSEVVEAYVELRPRPDIASDKIQTFRIYDGDTLLPYQFICSNRNNAQVVQNMNDSPNIIPTEQYSVRFFVSDIPAMGYKTLRVVSLKKNDRATTPETMLTSPRSMENKYVAVTINSNGTFDVTNKETGKAYKGLGFFKDSSEIANPWEHITVEQEEVFTTLTETPRISIYRNGKYETAFKICYEWMLPESRSADDKTRSSHLLPLSIENIITLKKDSKYVEITTNLNNRCEDHYLQVGFPTDIFTDSVYAQGQFDVVKRQIAKLDYSMYDEPPMTEHPMNSFVTMSDGKDGVAILNNGLKAYEVDDIDVNRTMYITLFRAFPLRICVCSYQDYSQSDKGSQCLGKHTYKYAFYPYAGDHEKANVWQESEKFTLDLSIAQIAYKAGGKNPMTHSFVELKDENLNISAVKQSEDEEGYVVRLFNYGTKTIKNSIRVNKGIAPIEKPQSPIERQQAEFYLPEYSGKAWGKCTEVTLEELPVKELGIGKDGFVDFEITPKKILTLKFTR